jgi:hypothetical protein
MPSRKKEQGQARKAEKERQACEQARAQQRASCKHVTTPENATQDDIDAAYSLLEEHVDGLNATMRDGRGDNDYFNLALQTYNKYFQYSDVRKQVFRKVILSQGTAECVKEANEIDLTNMRATMAAYPFVELLAMIEGRDKNQGYFDAQSEIELVKQLHATAFCPRETVRFFHRRNSCDCLHEIYYKLKDTTQRTFGCSNCAKAVDIKKAFHCKCEVYKYCSKKCALEHSPKHKETCRHARESN